tara:strand:+ start:113 stop:583 length:471 start_codon:yes stop_codon:yes gene_type:complete
MEQKCEEKESYHIENSKEKQSILTRLKQSQKSVEIFVRQNKQLQRQIDDLIQSDLNNNKEFIETFENYEKQIKKLEIDKECLLHKANAYETLVKTNKNDTNKDSVTCILCFDQPRNVLFRPCNHILICDNCSGKANYDECFVCRSKIVELEYAYLI